MSVWIERAILAIMALGISITALRLDFQNTALRESIVKAASQRIADTSIQPGSVIRSLRGSRDEHSRFVTPVSDGLILVITFSASCPTTKANIQSWLDAGAHVLGRGGRVIWVSRDDATVAFEFARRHDLAGLVLADVPHDVYVRLGLSVVPQTLVMQGGVVRASWQGPVDSTAILGALNP